MFYYRQLLVFYSFIFTASCSASGPNKGATSATKPSCPYPAVVNTTLQNRDNIVDLHRHAADVLFDGNIRKRQRTACKIRCINGEWVGPVCQTVPGDDTFHTIYKSCTTDLFLSNFIVSYKNKTILGAKELEHNERIRVRCREFGLYKLIGDSRIVCHNGHWKPRPPTCIPTSGLNNFTDDSSPPTIQVKITSGSVSIEPSGELAVYPGSVLHLECLHARSQGEPEWSWTSTYRTYPTGWSIATDERDWKYRLSIYYVKPQDTGIYTCATPKGLTHSAIINVLPVQCNAAQVASTDPHLLIHVEGSRLGQRILFTCSHGYKLFGLPNATCQASGTWSAEAPRCLPVTCPTLEVPLNSRVKLLTQATQYEGRAVFECPPGHKLVGSATLLCNHEGQWNGDIPHCKEIICSPPLIPQNGKLEMNNGSSTSSYGVGAMVTFSCRGVYQLEGENTIVCTDAGFWSNPPPFCKTKCSRLDKLDHGDFIPQKNIFEVGERVTLVCDDGYASSTKARPRCLRSGQWTEQDIQCRQTSGPVKHRVATTNQPMMSTIQEMDDQLTATVPSADYYKLNDTNTTVAPTY